MVVIFTKRDEKERRQIEANHGKILPWERMRAARPETMVNVITGAMIFPVRESAFLYSGYTLVWFIANTSSSMGLIILVCMGRESLQHIFFS